MLSSSNPMNVLITRLPHGAGLPLPSYQSASASGLDVHAAIPRELTVEPGRFATVPCGIALAVPDGFEAQIRPRSGLAADHGISVLNAPGTIDADYRGEIKVLLVNHGTMPFCVQRGMRIAQIVIAPVIRVTWSEVSELPRTQRGDAGYGHSGV